MLHDIVIVGAGPVGATLALALRDSDLDVVVLDARGAEKPLRADRALALSHGARLIFERLGVWSSLAATPGALTPIATVDISQSGGFGMTRLTAEEQGLPALGYVVSYRALQNALDRALAASRIAVRFDMPVTEVAGASVYAAVTVANHPEPITASMVVVADGAGAVVAGIQRIRRDYEQVAVVAEVWPAAAHGGVAYERFTGEGPIALLPQGDHYGLVWTQKPEHAARMLALSDSQFVMQAAQLFGARVPRLLRVADRRSFPLALEIARPMVASRVVAVGNAAQALHPVAGQGFNLGLRDAWELAQAIIASPREQLGDHAMLRRYASARAPDRLAGIGFTHLLVRAFDNDLRWLRWPRGVALALLDAMPSAKSAFTRAMLFGLR